MLHPCVCDRKPQEDGSATSLQPPPAGATTTGAGPVADPALVVRQGNITWVKSVPQDRDAEQQRVTHSVEEHANQDHAQRAAPGSERPAAQLGAAAIEQVYGRGFEMLAKMGYKHDDEAIASRTPIAVVSKTCKQGLRAAGEDIPTGNKGVPNGKQLMETEGKDAEFVKAWLRKVLKSCEGQWGTMEPLALSRLPDLWGSEFSGKLPVKTLGFKKLVQMLQAWSDVVTLVHHSATEVALLPAAACSDISTPGTAAVGVVQQGASKRPRLEQPSASTASHDAECWRQWECAQSAGFGAYAQAPAAAAATAAWGGAASSELSAQPGNYGSWLVQGGRPGIQGAQYLNSFAPSPAHAAACAHNPYNPYSHHPWQGYSHGGLGADGAPEYWRAATGYASAWGIPSGYDG